MKRSAHHRAFTLLELMVAMALCVCIMLAALSVLNSGSSSYRRVSHRLTLENEMRMAMGELHRDLAVATRLESLSVRHDPLSGNGALGFLVLMAPAVQAKEACIGDLCAVRYTVRDVAIGDRSVRCLMRGVSESAVTFDALRNDKLDHLMEPAAADEAIACGVISFQIKLLQRGEGGGWQTWQRERQAVPSAIEFTLALVRPERAARLVTPEDWQRLAQEYASVAGAKPQDEIECHRVIQPIGRDEAF